MGLNSGVKNDDLLTYNIKRGAVMKKNEKANGFLKKAFCGI